MIESIASLHWFLNCLGYQRVAEAQKRFHKSRRIPCCEDSIDKKQHMCNRQNMTQDPLFRDVQLANGDRVTLYNAALHFIRLQCLLTDDGFEWDPVPLLRKKAFGFELLPQQEAMLRREKLVSNETGQLDPEFRSVILSSIRGVGDSLHLEPPFTDPVDLSLANLIISREHIRVELPELADKLFGKDDLMDLLKPRPSDDQKPRQSWRDKEDGRNDTPGSGPTP